MKRANIREDIQSMTRSGNYLGAYSGIDLVEDELEKRELVGELVETMVIDLENQTMGKNKERVYYLRSLLLYIFRDYPGLSGIYRLQLRSDEKSDLFGLFRGLGDAAKRTGEAMDVPNSVEDAVEALKRNVNEFADDVKSGQFNEKVKDFFSKAEESMRESFRHVNDVYDGMQERSDRSQDAEDADADADAEKGEDS
jgi:hypothetical protein